MLSDVRPVARARLTDEDRTYALYHFDLAQRMLDSAQRIHRDSSPAKFGAAAELLGYDLKSTVQGTTLLTYWRAGDQISTPLQMFVHVLGPEGSIIAQQDQLDAPPAGWRAGDLIAQVTRFDQALAPEDKLAIGLYNPDSGERLLAVSGDQVVDQVLLK